MTFCTECGASLEVRRCPTCGEPVAGQFQFCTSCGATLTDEPMVTEIFTQDTARSTPQSERTHDPVRATGRRAASHGRKKKARPLWIGVALLLLLMIPAGIYLFGESDEEPSQGIAGQSTRPASEALPAFEEPEVLPEQRVAETADTTVRLTGSTEPGEEEVILEAIQGEAFEGLQSEFLDDELLLLTANHFDAGLAPGEHTSGIYTIEVDLAKKGIDPALYEDLIVFRRGDTPGDFELLGYEIRDDLLVYQTNHNSVTGLLFTLGVVAKGAHMYEEHKAFKDAFGDDPYDVFYGKDLKKEDLDDPRLKAHYQDLSRYTFYYPIDLGFNRPDEVKKAIETEIRLYQEKGLLDPSESYARVIDEAMRNHELPSYPGLVFDYLEGVQKLPDVQAIERAQAFVKSEAYKAFKKQHGAKWKRENLLPFGLTKAIDAVLHANYYLYTERDLLSPPSVMVMVSKRAKDLGSSYNAAMLKPYLTLRPMEKNADAYRQSEYLVTAAHELLHVTQSSRYLYGVDWKANTWFWEATAILLENEAAAFYKSKELVAGDFQPMVQEYFQSYARAIGDEAYWGSLGSDELAEARQNQGYAMGYALLKLRDLHYQEEPKAYLKRLLTAYKGSWKDPIESIVKVTTGSHERFQNSLGVYYRGRINDMITGTNKALTPGNPFHEWMYPEVTLNRAKPYVAHALENNPYASPIRSYRIDLDRQRFQDSDDVSIAILLGDDEVQQSPYFDLQVARNNKRFEAFTAERLQLFENFGGESFFYLQEMHLYNDSWLDRFEAPYHVFLMVEPDPMELEKEEDELVLRIPNPSPLVESGTVTRHLVTLTDPKGQVLLFEMEGDVYRLELNASGDLVDYDDPQMKSMMQQAAIKYLAQDPEYRQQLVDEYGEENLQKGIEGIGDLEFDLGALGRAAEVLENPGQKLTYRVTYREMIEAEQPVYGPESDGAVLEVEGAKTAGIDLVGTWSGSVQMSGQKATLTIAAGGSGYDYKIENSIYGDEVDFYGKDLGNGTVGLYYTVESISADEASHAAMIVINSKDEIYLTAPPIVLKRQ